MNFQTSKQLMQLIHVIICHQISLLVQILKYINGSLSKLNFFASTNIEIYQWFPIEIKQYGCEIKQYGCDVPCPYNTTISCSFAVPESITITTAIVIKMMSYTLKLMFFNKRYFYGRRIIRLTRE